jgi:hypothetical protein
MTNGRDTRPKFWPLSAIHCPVTVCALLKQLCGGGEVGDQSQAVRRQMLAEALRHLESALELMDAAAAPPEIGAQLDFTLHQLAREINSSEVGQVQSNLRSVASQ